jgi:uncharacterized coiled-coil protein SlyX
MKTAMQELIDEMNEMLIEGNGSIYVLKEQARRLLKNEKEQMVDFAFKYGDLTTREIADSFDKEYKTKEK